MQERNTKPTSKGSKTLEIKCLTGLILSTRMTHDQEEERSTLLGTIQKNLWMWQRQKGSINNRACTGQSEADAVVRPVPTLSSLLGPGLMGWQQGSTSPPRALSFSFWLASLLDRCTPFIWRKRKSSPFSGEISVFEILQVWKYFYSWVIIWLVMKLPERYTFILVFWRHVLCFRFHHGYCDVWWYF